MTRIQATPRHQNARPAVGQVPGRRAIGRMGTAARVLVGLALLGLGAFAGGSWITWWQLALGLVGFPAALAVAQLARLAVANTALRDTDHGAFCINALVFAALLSIGPTRNATLVFLGASMLLAAWRGYGGCESLAISNWLLRRNDQVGCMLFSPVDAYEARRRGPSQPTSSA